ncbi:TPA: glycoside hydrolase family 43 protein [Klebsiella pneumoniae]|nr:glycoside hydrolase family 43 protein [Klebsiella pneumoniae]
MNITNPILKGFNPDPSIVRVGDDYYIATSTFEWFPGIQIHHSKDLIHWHHIGYVLTSTSQLDMKGMDNSEGIYAPNITYADNRFWVCYSVVQSCRGGSWMSTPCYLVTAENIDGPWSIPVRIGGLGFDPSLFHDDDGKKYVVNLKFDGRLNTNYFDGITLQEFDHENNKLVGKPTVIFKGTQLGVTEGPQILKENGYYYLITAEGGTETNHAVSICRSKYIQGPYEVHPQNPILTSRFEPNALLSRAGHGYMVKTQNDKWYLSHLCSRRISGPEPGDDKLNYSILGRESALQLIRWQDNWPYVVNGIVPSIEVQSPCLPDTPWEPESERDNFDLITFRNSYQTLREPVSDSWASLTCNPGHLRLRGRDYLYSRYEQSFLAQRLRSHRARIETKMFFSPESPSEMAGICAYYSRTSHYFLKMSADNDGKHLIQIVGHIDDMYQEFSESIMINDYGYIYLSLELNMQWYSFAFSLDGINWQKLPPLLDSTKLSDEAGKDCFRFTGTMLGLFSSDVSGNMKHADFDYFEYKDI